MLRADALANYANYANWSGTVATVIGAAIVAPRATLAAFTTDPRDLLISMAQRVRGWARAAGGFVWHRLLRRSRRPRHWNVYASDSAAGSDSVGSVTVLRSPPDGSADQKIDWLEKQVLGLWHHMEERESAHKAALRAAVSSLETADRGALAKLRALESQVIGAEQDDHEINARAFPVIAFGAILSGVPDDLAR